MTKHWTSICECSLRSVNKAFIFIFDQGINKKTITLSSELQIKIKHAQPRKQEASCFSSYSIKDIMALVFQLFIVKLCIKKIFWTKHLQKSDLKVSVSSHVHILINTNYKFHDAHKLQKSSQRAENTKMMTKLQKRASQARLALNPPVMQLSDCSVLATTNAHQLFLLL